jgi:predicted Zn-dependent protease
MKIYRLVPLCLLFAGLALPLAAQETNEEKIEVPEYGSLKSFWGRNDGVKSDSGSSSGSGLFSGLFGSSKTHEKFKGKFIATLSSLKVVAPAGIIPEQTGLQLARREAIGEHSVPVPLSSIKTYAEQVLDRLLRNSGITGVNPKVVIVADQQIHGHAFPDGTILLTLGAIRNLKTEDQLAALLSHELSHIILNHNDSDWFMGAQEQGLAVLQFGLDLRENIKKARSKTGEHNEFEDLKIRYIAKGVVFGSQLLIASPFSRVQEDEADLLGVDLFARANYSTDDMDRMMEALVSQEKQNLEDAKKRKADQEEALKELPKLGREKKAGEKKGLFKSVLVVLDGLFDKITDSITDQYGAKHRVATERRAALGEYLDREYDDAKPVKAESQKWLKVKGTAAIEAVLDGYRHVYLARNAINGDDYQTAAVEIRTALRHLGRGHGSALSTAGLIEARAGRIREAERYFKRSLSVEQPVLSAYTVYAELLRRENRPKESGLILRRAVADLKDPPQLLPDQIDLARMDGAKQPKKAQTRIAALFARCKLSPLKKLSNFCKDAVQGKYTRLPKLPANDNLALGKDGRLVEITGTSLRVRDGPDRTFPVLATVRKGAKLEVLGDRNRWLQIRTESGAVGWVAKSYTRAVIPTVAAAPAIQKLQMTRPVSRQAGGSSGNDFVARLKKLKQAHEQGLVTDAEYDAKRKELLKSL